MATVHRLGTRGSPLALAQAREVISRLGAGGGEVEIVTLRTRAEDFPDRPAAAIGVGIFTKEIDEALLRGDVDFAVHSFKDVPSRLADGLVVAAVLERESPLDALVAASGGVLTTLPARARVGTGSPRRRAQLLAARPDLEVVDLRGNVDTRLRKVQSGEVTAIVLALAGLRRLGRESAVTEVLSDEVMVPAVAQGAIAVVARCGDARTIAMLERIDHSPSRFAVECERAFLEELRGGCLVPAGALARLNGDRVSLTAVIAAADGSSVVRGRIEGGVGDRAADGRELALRLLDRGGAAILDRARREER